MEHLREAFLTCLVFVIYWMFFLASRTTVLRRENFLTNFSRILDGGNSHNNRTIEIFARNVSRTVPKNITGPPKTVLVWTFTWAEEIQKNKSKKIEVNCHNYRCLFTGNRSVLAESAAVVFVHRFVKANDLPTLRFPWQRWIMWTSESPAHKPLFPTFMDGKINWTMTYHRNADIHVPYGHIIRKGEPEEFDTINIPEQRTQPQIPIVKNYTDIVKMKTNHTLWLVSNCGALERIKYVKEMQKKGLQVDIYGKCAEPDPCKWNLTCYKERLSKYKFYLAFENSHCEDYMTEKFWKALMAYTIPVVMGPSVADCKRWAPPDSFIHVDNFPDAATLVAYLIHLDQDDSAYSWYHRWRQEYQVLTQEPWACKVCKKVHEDVKKKVYPSMYRAWPPQMCSFVTKSPRRTFTNSFVETLASLGAP